MDILSCFSSECRFNSPVAPVLHLELKSEGWQVRWFDGVACWTAAAIRGKEQHSSHANNLTLAFQELEASCAMVLQPLPAVIL